MRSDTKLGWLFDHILQIPQLYHDCSFRPVVLGYQSPIHVLANTEPIAKMGGYLFLRSNIVYRTWEAV